MNRPKPEKNRGVALVSVLIAVAIIANLALLITYDQEVDISRTTYILQKEQAVMYALGMEQWAKIFLAQDLAENNYDSKTDFWYGQQMVFPVDGGVLSGHIEPLQAKYNINTPALSWPKNKRNLNALTEAQKALVEQEEAYLQRILQQSNLDANSISAILDWLDPNDKSRGDNTESSYYEAKELPYRAADYSLASLDELKVIQGFDQINSDNLDSQQHHQGNQGGLSKLAALKRFLTALPLKVPVNINLADEKLLQALHEDLSSNLVKQVIAIREQQENKAFAELEAFYQALEEAEQEVQKQTNLQNSSPEPEQKQQEWQERIPAERLSVSNDFFALYTKLMFGEVEYRLRSLIQRVDRGDIRIIQREFYP